MLESQTRGESRRNAFNRDRLDARCRDPLPPDRQLEPEANADPPSLQHAATSRCALAARFGTLREHATTGHEHALSRGVEYYQTILRVPGDHFQHGTGLERVQCDAFDATGFEGEAVQG